MKKDYTHISVVLDRSGSMNSIRNDTIGGFNQFLKDQQAVSGKATITLVQFDHAYKSVYDSIPIADAKPLDEQTFVPRGSTALLDAIGRTINDLGARLSEQPEDARPEKVVFVIITDGEENASHEFSLDAINQMIKTQREVYSWEFVFLGANQDAIKAAVNIGISPQAALSYAANQEGVVRSFRSASKNLSNYRGGVVGQMVFDDSDREEQRKAGLKESK